MKILIVSNLYPPYYIGGYETGCRDVAEGLKVKGHQVLILTSTYGLNSPETQGDVLRHLAIELTPTRHQYQETGFWEALFKERQNQRCFVQVCKQFKPDVVYFWNMRSCSISLAFLAQRLALSTYFFVSDNWFAHWENDTWITKCQSFAKRRNKLLLSALRVVAALWRVQTIIDLRLDTANVQFCSNYLRQDALQVGKPVQDAQVIHWGVSPEQFCWSERDVNPTRFLYVGQVVPHKGVHTLIEAMRLLVHDCQYAHLTLTIVGDSKNEDYKAHLCGMVKTLGLEANVHFTGALPREQLPDIYRNHDVLILPSIWAEPFAITPIEAMSSGLAVVGTTTGGSPEIFNAGVNALTFVIEDAQDCANQLARLIENPGLYRQIRHTGHQTVARKFTMQNMIDTIEQSLAQQQKASAPCREF